jgi:hypothetical protein
VSALLLDTLTVSVPLCLAELQQLNPEERRIQVRAWSSAAAPVLVARSDLLLFSAKGSKGSGVFAHLSRGLAALAHAPGGVRFAGVHWCIEHPQGLLCAAITDLTCATDGFATDDKEFG